MSTVLPISSEEWRLHWQASGFSWRTEPEIDEKRQEELSTCHTIVPDIEKGIYPFKGMKLSRADVEWLLATHENGRGPVDWNDEGQQEREGLDLRGADLQHINLGGLPLAGMIGGLTGRIWRSSSPEQDEMAAVRMQGALLMQAQLAGAKLNAAYLDRANLFRSHLEQAELWNTSLKGASLSETRLGGAILTGAHLEGADLDRAHLEGVSTAPADLTWAVFDSTTVLRGVTLGNAIHGYVRVADVNWGGANLTVVKWSQVGMLGDEQEARQKMRDGKKKDAATRLEEFETAVRANRQLANVLQAQALNEDAARFAYRAQILQRKVLWKQRDVGKWLFSMLLALVAGYGYRMWRILVAYLCIVLLCAGAYFILGMYYQPHLSLLDAVLTSITAFHGRVFSEPFLRPGEPQLWVTAFEAIAGLVIEGVFIAMLTQKFFGK